MEASLCLISLCPNKMHQKSVCLAWFVYPLFRLLFIFEDQCSHAIYVILELLSLLALASLYRFVQNQTTLADILNYARRELLHALPSSNRIQFFTSDCEGGIVHLHCQHQNWSFRILFWNYWCHLYCKCFFSVLSVILTIFSRIY